MRKRKSITTQLMSQIILLVTLLMAMVIGFTILITNATVRKMAESELKKEAYGNEKVLEKFISDAVNSLKPVKNVMENIDFKNDEERLSYLTTTVEMNENIPNGIYMGDDRGHYLDASLWVPEPDYVVTERDWYKEGVSREEFALGTPYLDKQSGQMVVSISAKVNLKGWGYTAMVGDLFLDSISAFISDLSVMDAGYSFVFDAQNGVIVAHKDTACNGKTMTEAADSDGMIQYLVEQTGSIENRIMKASVNGESYMALAQPVEGSDWYLVACVPEKIVMDKLYDLLYRISVIAVFFTAAVLIIIAFSIRQKTKPIKKLTKVIEGITSGDFTMELTPAGNNEITTMTEKLKVFIESMGDTIRHLSAVSLRLGEQSESSAGVSRELSEAASVQSESMGQLNTTVDDLAHSVENIAENATSLAEAVGVVFNNGSDAEEKVNETVSAAEKGRKDIEKVASNMDKIHGNIHTLSDIVQEVGASTEEINKITGLIGDIAGQTNLLALNASIEAARAGEAGRGFAVVADEIGKLANMSADAVKQISDLIGKINSQVANTIDQTGQSVENIKESKVLVDISYKTFMEIYDKVMMTSDNIKNVTSKIREVDDVASSMAAITEEQSASTEEILATSESLYAQSQHIAENSHSVEAMAEELEMTAASIRQRMSEFKA